jgi:hypothetical protein
MGKTLPNAFEKRPSVLVQNGYLVLPKSTTGSGILRIVDPVGKIIFSTRYDESRGFKHSLNNLPNGMLFMELTGGAQGLVKRFFIQK